MKRLKTFVSPRSRHHHTTPRVSSSPRRVSHQRNDRALTVPRSDNSPTATVTVDQLKDQVSLLRERIQVLDDSSTDDNSMLLLLDDSKENEDPFEAARNQQDLGVLQSQFQDIQRGLSHVEAERRALRESKSNLEAEKRKIQRQLEIREREVMTLVKRCQSQDEKMREATKLRASHSNLSTQLEGLKSTLSMKDEELSQIEKLQKELEDCQEARRELKTRIFHLKKDHDDVVDTLNSCFQNMQRLQEKQQDNDEDRKRDTQRADLAMEKQRLSHQETVNEVKADLHNRQERIEQMEVILRDNMATSTALRRERAELKESLEGALSQTEESARKLSAMEQEHQSSQSDYAAQLVELRSTLSDKDSVIEAMEEEVSTCMDKLMALSEEVEIFREEQSQRDRESQVSTEKLEQENWTLKEKVSAKDLEVIVLSTSVSILESDKVELLEQLQKLEDRIRELEEDNAFIMDLEEQLDDVNFSVLEAQEDNTRVEETYDQAVSDIQQEFDQQRDMWNEMEKGLMERVASLESAKNQIELDLGAQLAVTKEENTTLHNGIEASKLTVLSLESTHSRAQKTASSQSELIADIQGQLDRKQSAVAEKDATITQLRAELQVVQHSSQEAASDESEKNSKLIAFLRQQLKSEQSISDEKTCDLQRVTGELERTRDISQQQVAALKGQLLDQEKIAASLTEKLNDERRAKINSVKSLREENDSFRMGWREELNQANELLNQKRKQVETLQLDLASSLSKGEKEQVTADRAVKVQSERLDSMERDLHEQHRQLQQKTTESERLKAELTKTKEHMQTEISSMMDHGSENERKVMSLEVDLRLERSACEGKESALGAMGAEMGAMRQLLTDEERTVVSLQKEVGNLRTALDQDLSQRDEALTVQVHQVAMLSTQLGAKRTLLEGLTQERDNLSDELKSREADLFAVNERVSRQSARIEELSSKLAEEQDATASCRDRIQELECGLTKAMTELSNRSADRNTLTGELSVLQKDILINQDLLKAKAETISSLKQEYQQLKLLSETKTSTLEELRTELKDSHVEFESELSVAQKKQAEQDRAITSLQADLRQDKLAIHQREATVSSLTGEVESLRFKIDQDAKAWANEIVEKEDIIASRDSELTAIKSSLEQGTAMLGQEVKNQSSKVCALRKEVSNLEYEMEEKERKTRAVLAEKETEVAELQKELCALTEQKQASDERFLALLSERDSTIENMGKRSQKVQSDLEVLMASSQTEIRSLKHNLQKVEIDLAISQDELRDVQMIDLKEAEETIESLESSLQALRTKTRGDETSKSVLINELQAQIDQLESRLNSAGKGSADTKHLHDKTMLKIQGEVDALKQDNDALNDELKQQFEKLNARHATITALTAEKAKLERTESRLRGEIESLESDCKKAWEEQEKTAYALDREIGKHSANRQDEDIEFQKRQSSLQKQLEASQSKVSSLMKQVVETEETIDGRTALLADMVAHNKETEEQKERYLSELSDIKEETVRYKSDLEESKQELARLKSAFTKKEDQLLEAIQSEREMREVAEVELENAHSRLHNSNRDDKEVSELEKENEVLRDKVRRQEAYLKRKLQKDKVLRERITKPSGIATPSRTTALRKPLSSAKGGRLTPLAENLFPDELDQVLG